MSKPDQPPSASDTAPGIEAGILDRMIEIRRHLHRHPELSNREAGTQRYLREMLAKEGITEIRDVAGYGLAVDIVGTGRPSNRKVAIRADIDALPIEEESGLDFASENPGVMHACGHDAHAAMGFAVAAHLNRSRNSFGGTVRLIFQPAEEDEPSGGKRVVEEGLLDDVDAAICVHVDPYTPSGKVAVGSGPYTLACDTFDVLVTGSAAHAAKPYEGIDALTVACSMVGELQKIVSRETDPYDPLVISVTAIDGGNAYNVTAGKVAFKGTIRSGNDATRERAWRRLREMLEGMAASHGASVKIDIHRGEPGVVNDAGMAALIMAGAKASIGADNVLNMPGWSIADDFGYYSEKIPSVYFRLGIRNEAVGSVYPLHHSRFRVDEAALKNGVLTLVSAATMYLAGQDNPGA
ncbi:MULTISPECIES: M20 family metallopeptidase [unclassified Mesorhizobium]|uniref:M20 metallopeptidase family protein n=1 Tax=unclassified Mesorhizobium TaxID=325217 RepID=UPI000FD97FCD|nr:MULTISPECIES: M20 family metallopeptidase [unclassified Mesorhizobium]TGQ17552.1 amidohydrolase [Mesorhizobium sp. M2E.F.Ca.ET.219.01.1.1]TGT76291.1 amidohydrolase [Mesorhizobium sp. M2E.F.Ca.ET.166.01.1.1]TGW02406.1 amidohydrolase [Mesorhizobium sp. M2E.F.Ca.ET.154.01.1.1]